MSRVIQTKAITAISNIIATEFQADYNNEIKQLKSECMCSSPNQHKAIENLLPKYQENILSNIDLKNTSIKNIERKILDNLDEIKIKETKMIFEKIPIVLKEVKKIDSTYQLPISNTSFVEFKLEDKKNIVIESHGFNNDSCEEIINTVISDLKKGGINLIIESKKKKNNEFQLNKTNNRRKNSHVKKNN